MTVVANTTACSTPSSALHLTSSDFVHVAAWGLKRNGAIARCPRGFDVIAGGSSSRDGGFVGAGHPTRAHNGWFVRPNAGASAEAFATCVTGFVDRAAFEWRSAGPIAGIATARCSAGYTIVTGYGIGSVRASWFDGGANTFSVRGDGKAYASCVRGDAGVILKHAWNHSQHPKSVFAGCGIGYAVIGGSMGDEEWPGPPLQQHPGIAATPSVAGFRGWWTFSNARNELTWAVCVKER